MTVNQLHRYICQKVTHPFFRLQKVCDELATLERRVIGYPFQESLKAGIVSGQVRHALRTPDDVYRQTRTRSGRL